MLMSVANRGNLRNSEKDLHETELIQTNDTYADFFDDFFDKQQNVKFWIKKLGYLCQDETVFR